MEPLVRPPGISIRCVEDLRLHPALSELGWGGDIGDLNEASTRPKLSVVEPISITTTGTILGSFGIWRLAIFEKWDKIACTEYPLDQNEALQRIILYHRPSGCWNAFMRTCLALKLEHCLQQKAINNMRDGGRYKGLASLPEAQRIDVREQIADIAGTSPRNVSKVKAILKDAHPHLVEALRSGELKINRAIKLCECPPGEQLEQFIRYSEEQSMRKVIRQLLPRTEKERKVDFGAVLDSLRRQEVRHPDSISVRISSHKRTILLIGQDLSAESPFHKQKLLT